MVLKLAKIADISNPTFESDVISDGTQTLATFNNCLIRFESDVISDGTQTFASVVRQKTEFESDVISDGTQT